MELYSGALLFFWENAPEDCKAGVEWPNGCHASRSLELMSASTLTLDFLWPSTIELVGLGIGVELVSQSPCKEFHFKYAEVCIDDVVGDVLVKRNVCSGTKKMNSGRGCSW